MKEIFDSGISYFGVSGYFILISTLALWYVREMYWFTRDAVKGMKFTRHWKCKKCGHKWASLDEESYCKKDGCKSKKLKRVKN